MVDQISPKFSVEDLIKKTGGSIYFQDISNIHVRILSEDDEHLKLVKEFFKADPDKKNLELILTEQRCLASMIASVLGDALGAHLEFEHFDPSRYFFKVGFEYEDYYYSTRCKSGQWTDDSSMALCVADSLIENKKEFNGVDLRTRFLYWWHTGYNNGLKEKRSFGLGGNIAESFACFYREPKNPKMRKIRGINNGNGSLMRLAPIPIAFLKNIEKGMEYAKEHSLTTHDGEEAAECCRLLTFLIIQLINRENFDDWKKIFDELGTNFKTPCASVENLANSKKESIEGFPKAFNQDENDRNWNWKKKDLYRFSETRLRNNSGYIGSYCMDGLAMALNITYNSAGVIEDLVRAVNLGGDCDSVGAMVGSISGAIHGLEEGLIQQYKEYVTQWDDYTIAARALKLCREK